MPAETTISPKPRSEVVRPNLVRLAELNRGRRIFRKFIRWLSKFMVFLWTRAELKGLENVPEVGPALIVANHLGDADLILGFAYGPPSVEPFGKIELTENKDEPCFNGLLLFFAEFCFKWVCCL